MKPLRVLYAAGPGDVIGTYRHWKTARDDPSEMSTTYSGQFFTVCRRLGMVAHVVVQRRERRRLVDGNVVIEEIPTPFQNHQSAMLFHMGQLYNAIRLFAIAIIKQVDVAIVLEGTHWFALALLRCAGVKVVPDLHCTLWPMGHPSPKPVRRLIGWLNGIFWSYCPAATLCVSPECERQVKEVSGGRARNLLSFGPTYPRGFLADIAPPHRSGGPFVLLYAGRIERNKGVLDLVSVMRTLDESHPGTFELVICGSGGASTELERAIANASLSNTIRLAGQLDQTAMMHQVASCHAMIVPTTSSFVEGLNRVAVESILAGRPVIVTSVCPAWELLEEAAIVVSPGDVTAMCDAARRLQRDATLYESKRRACAALASQFYDPSHSWGAAFTRALHAMFPSRLEIQRETQPA